MRKRFSPAAAAAVYFAETLASQLGHSYVGTEHLLLGLTRAGDDTVDRLLAAEGLTPALLLEELLFRQGSGAGGLSLIHI